MPYPSTHHLVSDAVSKRDTVYEGEPPLERTIFVVLTLFLTMILSLLLGARFSRLRQSAVKMRNITSILVLNLYLLVLTFLFSSAVLVAGQGLYNEHLCSSIIWICLILYLLSKGTVYIFLVERIRIIRAPFVRRHLDWLYWLCTFVVVAGFLGCGINIILHPIYKMRPERRCWVGVQRHAIAPLLSFDILIDFALTGIFLFLLLPTPRLHGLKSDSLSRSSTVQNSNASRTSAAPPVQRNIRTLLWKSLIGTLFIMVPTIANVAQIYIAHGREPAILCMSLCIADISGDAIVLYWLTFGSTEVDREFNHSAQESIRPSTPRSPRPMDSQQTISSQPNILRTDLANTKNEAGHVVCSVMER